MFKLKQITEVLKTQEAVAPQDSPTPGVMATAAISLGKGELRIDSKEGISFELHHICQDDDDNDPSPELLGQLIDGMVRDFRQIEMLVLQGRHLIETFTKIATPIL